MLSKRIFLIITLVMSIASVAYAQQLNVELPNTHTFSDGAVVSYPANWLVEPLEEAGVEQFTSQESVVEFYLAVAYEDYELEQGDIAGYLAALFEEIMAESELELDADVIELTMLDDRNAALYDYINVEGEEALMLVIEFSNGKVGAIHALTLDNELTEREVVLAMAETYNAVLREFSRRDVALARQHTLEEDVIIDYPSHFDVDTSGASYDLFESDDSSFVVYVPRPYSVYELEAGDVGGFLEQLFIETMSSDGLTIDTDSIEVGTMDGRLTALYDYIDSYGDEALMIVIQLSDGRVGAINAWSYKGQLIERNMAISMAVSYDVR